MPNFSRTSGLVAPSSLLTCAAAWLLPLSVSAEGPMNTDDAGTLARGGFKVESVLSRDDQTRGAELIGAFGLLEGLEVALTGTGLRDRTERPATQLRGTGFSAKWVPYQNGQGWSVGMRFDYGRTRIQPPAPAEKITEKDYALTGLASYHWDQGQVFHLNGGAVQTKRAGESRTVGHWGLGYEHPLPLLPYLQGTIEIFGAENSRPDKAIGLRYQIQEGLKVYGALGHGNGRGFGSIGVAWEF